MAELQSQFNKFHEIIKIDFEGNKPLRDKRDIILDALRGGLKKKYPINTPTFDWFNQGSYDMSTGVEPIDGNDYDIDVGVIFKFSKDRNDPVNVKKVVFDILDAVYQRKVEVKKPCVRIQYQQAGENAYHIDLAIYARGESYNGNLNDMLYIAKGKLNSLPQNKFWEISEPYKLKELIKNKVSDNADREQFRRVIKYLKRWKDFKFSSLGTERPTGIALTALCYNLFNVEKDYVLNHLNTAYSYKYNDLRALLKVVRGIQNQFTYNNKISVNLLVNPYNNLFEKMSETQMLNFKQKLEFLKSMLEYATNEIQTINACMRLRDVFGEDFPKS